MLQLNASHVLIMHHPLAAAGGSGAPTGALAPTPVSIGAHTHPTPTVPSSGETCISAHDEK